VHARVLVDLSDRRLTLFENGRRVLRVPVAVGAPATPTPRGRFFVVERIRVSDSGGPYGAYALALSAFSEKLTYWPDGGPVAIHGTDDPSSIGRAVSHGCVRLSARDLPRVFSRVELGTPVEIVS
jgi:lipoprotein-anchoring transpeptidase ErfK/SrfK